MAADKIAFDRLIVYIILKNIYVLLCLDLKKRKRNEKKRKYEISINISCDVIIKFI